jgi:hypothetical protein
LLTPSPFSPTTSSWWPISKSNCFADRYSQDRRSWIIYIYTNIHTVYIYMIYDISMKPILGLGKKKRNRNIPNWMHGTITGDPDMYRQNPMTSCNIYIYTPWTVLNVIFVGKPPRWIQMFDGFWWWNLQFFGG